MTAMNGICLNTIRLNTLGEKGNRKQGGGSNEPTPPSGYTLFRLSDGKDLQESRGEAFCVDGTKDNQLNE